MILIQSNNCFCIKTNQYMDYWTYDYCAYGYGFSVSNYSILLIYYLPKYVFLNEW